MRQLKLALDVAYRDHLAAAGLVGFAEWDAAEPVFARTVPCRTPDRYLPGEFFRRELPCLLQALATVAQGYTHALVDGYVHLEEPKKGLGQHLYEHLEGRVAVIGVAKKPLTIARDFLPVYRGRSRRPLFVSAMGMNRTEAGGIVQAMAGRYRIPAMLKLADLIASRGIRG